MSRASWRSGVGTRLAIAAAATAVLVSVAMAVAAAWYTWSTEMRRVDEALRLVERVHLPSLAEDLWQFSPRLRQDVDAVVGLPHVAAVSLIPTAGERIAAGGGDGAVEVRTFPVVHPVGGRLGELRVEIAIGSLRAAVASRALLATIALILPVAITALAIVLLFRRLVGRHIDDLAAFAERTTIDTLDQGFRLQRAGHIDDELDRLAEAFARMRHNLAVEMAGRRRSEGALSDSEERFREVFDAAGDALFVHDAQGAVLEVNRSACELYRLDRAALLAAGSLERISLGEAPYDPAQAGVWLRRACSEGPQLFEWRARDSAGRQFWVEVFLKQVRIAGQERVIASVRDIDARKQAEEKVRHFQRLESVGQLAGGIAHDFNNMLAGILGSIELVLLRLPADHPSRRLLATAMQSGERAADLNRKLLSFARRNPQQVAARDLHALVDGTLALLERAIQPGIVIERRLEAGRTTVLADAAELQNAILNLCLNARDAMPQGGTITVRTADRQLSPTDCAAHAGFSLHPGPHVAVTVADTGTGIPDAIRARIFEPFFTTKEIGKGTGLGLSMVFGTVVAMGGAIAVESTSGQGSVFTVLLPVAPGPPVASGPQAPSASHLRDLGVLVVDDDVVPREMAVEMLGELGCTTWSAASGVQALAVLQQQGPAVGVVLLDMLMPGMSGVDAFAAIRAIRPDCRIVICSGFIRDTAVAGLLVTGNTCFLAKPYRIDDLAAALVEGR